MLRQLLSSSDNGQSIRYIPKIWTMLSQLLSLGDNGQSIVIYP